jgi:hypothetical protein
MQRVVTAAFCGVMLGACAMAQVTGADYLDLTRVQVRGDKTKEFEDTIKKMVDANRKFKGDRWIALSTEYGDFGGYSFSSTRENFAAVEAGQGAFMNALKEGFGPLSEKIMRDVSAFSASGYGELRRRRWDLSVNAPSSKDEMLKMVAQTRWIRTLTLDMKPGHTAEYIEAWKPFGDELRKASPAVPTLVSESSTGAPRLFVGVYYKSWAEMDASSSGVQRAIASGAYEHLMKVTQDSVSASKWEILRIRPDLSCAPDEVVAADPGFWKPKPPAPPKPKTEPVEKK